MHLISHLDSLSQTISSGFKYAKWVVLFVVVLVAANVYFGGPEETEIAKTDPVSDQANTVQKTTSTTKAPKDTDPATKTSVVSPPQNAAPAIPAEKAPPQKEASSTQQVAKVDAKPETQASKSEPEKVTPESTTQKVAEKPEPSQGVSLPAQKSTFKKTSKAEALNPAGKPINWVRVVELPSAEKTQDASSEKIETSKAQAPDLPIVTESKEPAEEVQQTASLATMPSQDTETSETVDPATAKLQTTDSPEVNEIAADGETVIAALQSEGPEIPAIPDPPRAPEGETTNEPAAPENNPATSDSGITSPSTATVKPPAEATEAAQHETDQQETGQQPTPSTKSEFIATAAKQDDIPKPFPSAKPPAQEPVAAISPVDDALSKGRPVLIRIFKSTSTLELWHKNQNLYERTRSFKLCKQPEKLGPKKSFSDGHVPEGFYHLPKDLMNWSWEKRANAIPTGFPNTLDLARRASGGPVYIASGCNTNAILSLSEADLDLLKTHVKAALEKVQAAIPLHIYPFQLRWNELTSRKQQENYDFWLNQKEVFDHFEKTRNIPQLAVCGQRYRLVKGGEARRKQVESRFDCMPLLPGTEVRHKVAERFSWLKRALLDQGIAHWTTKRAIKDIEVKCNLKRPSCRRWYALRKRMIRRGQVPKELTR